MEISPPPLLFNTILGSFSAESEESLQSIEFFLSHEHIFQDLSRFHSTSSQSQITLSEYDEISRDPTRISSNLVLNDYNEMIYELGLLSKAHKIAVIECTRQKNGKDIEKLQKMSKELNFLIFSGFEIFIDKKTLFQEKDIAKNQVFINKEAFLNKISLEFSLGGAQNLKPGFIGPLILSEIDEEIESLKLEAYIEFLTKNTEKIPLFIEFEESIKTFNEANVNSFVHLEKFLQKKGVKELASQIIFVNIPLIWVMKQEKSANFQIKIELQQEETIVKLLEMGFSLIFDVMNYDKNENFFLLFLQSLINKKFHRQIMISFGSCFKQYLKKYGGQGFVKLADFAKKLQIDPEIKKDLFCNNIWKIMQWKTIEETKPITIKKWKCPFCSEEFDENIEKFKKFDREFCSIKCLRGFFSKNN